MSIVVTIGNREGYPTCVEARVQRIVNAYTTHRGIVGADCALSSLETGGHESGACERRALLAETKGSR